jgi:hypothetical protein
MLFRRSSGFTRSALACSKVAAVSALLVGAVGCASTCPCRDDRSWRELSTPNFRLRTDLDEQAARERLAELELLRAALLTSLGVSADTRTGQLPVVAIDKGWGELGGPLALLSHEANEHLSNDGNARKECSRLELEAAFQADPDNTLALAVKTWEFKEPSDLARVQGSADKNPDDWMAWSLLATTLQRLGTDETRACVAKKKALQLAAGNPAIDLYAVPDWK